MKRIMILILIVGIGMVGACSRNTVPKTELEFANRFAREGLWKEAYYRWNKLLEQGKDSAALYNNIAVAYEEKGELEKAEAAYRKALKLSPGNSTVKSNYDKFKKMLEKEKDNKNEKEKDDKNKQ